MSQTQLARSDERLELIHDDAKAQLEQYPGTFDVIIGDLADPVFGGPCYQLYTEDFYKNVVAKKLSPGGIFVTQSGPCGMLSSNEVFTSIHNTLRQAFPAVVPYCCHIPSFADEWVRLSFCCHAELLVPANQCQASR
jgi:thermospermine synthase